MEGNPYYVKPADFSGGLNAAMSGFQSYVDDTAKQNEKTKNEGIMSEFAKTIASGDIAKIRAVTEKYPDHAAKFQVANEARSGIVKDVRANAVRSYYNGEKTAIQALTGMAENAIAAGQDATESISLIKTVLEKPELTDKIMGTIYALNAKPDEYKQFADIMGFGDSKSETPTGEAQYVKDAVIEAKNKKPDITESELATIRKNARIEHKRGSVTEVRDKAQTLSDVKKGDAEAIAGNTAMGTLKTELTLKPQIETAVKEAGYTVDNKYAAPLARRVEDAKLNAQLGIVPQIDAQKTLATGAATAIVDQAKETKSGSESLKTYDIAMDNLRKSLLATNTGPIVGKAPALTAKAQIAQNAVSNMTPVLKKIFREQGEGVFAKDDQIALINMLPTRQTNPEAVVPILNAIDAIVRSKLKQPLRIKTINSQAEYQSLPNGSEYLYNGQKFVKGK